MLDDNVLLGNRSTYYLPVDIENVPSDRVGVYGFYLSFPSDYQLGLSNGGENLERSVLILKDRLERYKSALERISFNGSIESDVFGVHLRKKYALSSHFEKTSFIDSLITEFFFSEGLSKTSFKLLTEVLRQSFLFSTPLYIGMTANQSFYTRLDQHIGYQSNFSILLKEQGITWSEVKFECVPISGLSSSGISNIEKIIQHLFKPPYCLG